MLRFSMVFAIKEQQTRQQYTNTSLYEQVNVTQFCKSYFHYLIIFMQNNRNRIIHVNYNLKK